MVGACVAMPWLALLCFAVLSLVAACACSMVISAAAAAVHDFMTQRSPAHMMTLSLIVAVCAAVH